MGLDNIKILLSKKRLTTLIKNYSEYSNDSSESFSSNICS